MCGRFVNGNFPSEVVIPDLPTTTEVLGSLTEVKENEAKEGADGEQEGTKCELARHSLGVTRIIRQRRRAAVTKHGRVAIWKLGWS